MSLRLGILALTPALVGSEAYGRTVRAMLEALAYVNGLHLAAFPDTPELYGSGVRYGESHPEIGFWFADIAAVQSSGLGICSALAAWRVAELRAKGEQATFRIEWKPAGAGAVFHVRVRRRNGQIEDPSEMLGMPPWD